MVSIGLCQMTVGHHALHSPQAGCQPGVRTLHSFAKTSANPIQHQPNMTSMLRCCTSEHALELPF